MRASLVLMLLLLATGCLSQTGDKAPSLFNTVHPDIVITVTKHPTGADMVVATAQKSDYPEELLRSQVADIAVRLGTVARGVQSIHYTMGGVDQKPFLRVTAAIDGLIDRKNHVLHVGAIAQAFAGTPAPYSVKGIDVTFDGETPSAHTVRRYFPASGTVRAEAQYTPSPPVIEYRIELLSDKPEEVWIPDTVEQNGAKTPSTAQRTGVDWTLWGLLAVGAVAAAALVYSLLLRSSSRPRS